jgi:micrococcal nuclease
MHPRPAHGKSPAHSSATRYRSLRRIALAWALSALAGQASCANEVFRWQDDKGGVHYSDRGEPGASKLKVQGATDAAPASSGYATVTRVYDGDTLTLEGGEKVRLLGINTPEIRGRRSGGEAGGQEARLWLAQRIQGQRVRLETDRTLRDKYGRLLAHIFAEDGTHLNLSLVEKGLATTDIFPPNLKYVEALLAAERRAAQGRRGLWALPDYQARPAAALRGEQPDGWQRLTGKPVGLDESRKYQRMSFADGFEIHIPREDLALFPPLRSYLGKSVEARGWVFCRGRGNCSMVIRHPSALLVDSP